MKDGGLRVNELVYFIIILDKLFNVENKKLNCSELVVRKRLKEFNCKEVILIDIVGILKID